MIDWVPPHDRTPTLGAASKCLRLTARPARLGCSARRLSVSGAPRQPAAAVPARSLRLGKLNVRIPAFDLRHVHASLPVHSKWR